jgi:hypothetical protein
MLASRFYLLGIFPDDSLHPIAIGSDKKLDLAGFLGHFDFPGWVPYIVCPACVFRLPREGFFEFWDDFRTDPERFHLRFYPTDHPVFMLRFRIDVGSDLLLCPWTVSVGVGESGPTFDDVLGHLRENFPVWSRGFDFDFGNAAVDPTGQIAEQLSELAGATVTLEVLLAGHGAAAARRRLSVITEIVETERSYVANLGLM